MSAPLESYFRLMTANGAVQVYHAARRAGIFDILAKEPMSVRALASAAELNERAVQLLVEALLALGLLAPCAVGVRLAEAMQALSGPYRALGNDYWAHIDGWLQTGEPIRRMDTASEGEAAYRGQAAALAWMMAQAAAQAAERLVPGLPKDAGILDLGAGSGVWSLALLAALPDSAATLVDRPGVLEVAREFVARAGMTSRVRLAAGDYRTIELPVRGYDLAILGNVCHLETDEGNEALLARTAGWLRPGGRIAILDVSPVREPLAAALYGLGLALRTEAARVPSSDRIGSWLAAAGFDEGDFQILPAPPGTIGLWTATRR